MNTDGSPLKIAALDLGGVCVTLHPDRVFRALKLSPLTPLPAEFHALCRSYETGMISTSAFFSRLSVLTGATLPLPELIDAWNLCIGESVRGMADAVARLVFHGWRVVFFSNTSSVHLSQVFRACDFAHLASGGVYSFEVHAMKPEPAMYLAFEQRFGVPSIYLDDRCENIHAAIQRGWNAVQFHSVRDLLNGIPFLNS